MPCSRSSLVLSASLVFSAAVGARGAGLAALQDGFAELAAAAKPAVVNITATHLHRRHPAVPFFFGDPDDWGVPRGRVPHGGRGPSRPRGTQGAGSGVLIDPRGYILTNHHVVSDAEKLRVTLTSPEGRPKTIEAKVVGSDPSLDLAVIKLEGAGRYPHLKLGDSSKIRVGDWAVAIGSPFGLEQTLTVGVISALRQSLPIEGRRYSNLIQTDAAINQGNSGGPLLNLQGEVIGINTAIYSPSGASAGVGFALAVNEAKEVLAALLEGRKVSHGFLGVELAEIDEVLRRSLDLGPEGAVLVNSVVPKSPAARAGVRRGDVILKLNGAPAESPEALSSAVRRLKAGSSARLEIARDGKSLELEAKLGERPEESAAGPAPWERREDSAERGSFSWEGAELGPAEEGVAVLEVEEDSPLYGSLIEGDVIRAVGKVQTPTVEAFRRAVETVRIKEGVALDVLRSGRPLYVSVKPS